MTPTPDNLAIPGAAVEMEKRAATYTCKLEYGPLYYFSLSDRAPPPYLSQRHVMAILDIAGDGTLAGVELIDNMPPPPASLPHMPDRGYADGIEAAAKVAEAAAEFPEEVLKKWDSFTILNNSHSVSRSRQARTIAAAIRALAPPTPADKCQPEAHDEDSILDVISGNLRMESWVAGKTLTVMFDTESGERRFAKLRLTKIAAQPSPADLKGEPE